MARIRSAKPEWWTDPRMIALPRLFRWTFKGLWEVCADDEGRFLADPRVIKGQIWPMDDDLTPRQIEKHLTAIADAGRILLYMVDGVRYGLVVNFLKHQKISHPTPSRLPPPPLGDVPNGSGNNPESYRNGSRKSPDEFRPERSGAGFDVDVDLERSGAEGPPDPPADAGSGKATAPAIEQLPYHARRLVSAMPRQKQADGAQQLLDALSNEGANLDGQRVHAFSAEHLDDACLYKLRGKRPDKPGLLARFVLQRLNDTFAEWKSRVDKSDEMHIAPVVAGLMPKPIDELDESHRWLGENPSVCAEIEAQAKERWADFPDTAGIRRQIAEWFNRETIARWKAAGSPVPATHETPTSGGST